MFRRPTTVIRPEVQAGVTLLDERVPGWRGRIDVDDLDLSSKRECVLGQLYGHFQEGVQQLGIRHQTCAFGFATGGGGHEYTKLTKEWKLALSA
jgi:hypothetical protein